ncbi:MAG: FtsX-like permease family protein [Acidobacteriota bacterium]
MRTLVGALGICLQVTMILTLVGLSRGVLGSMAERQRGSGADIVIKAPDSSALSYGLNMPEAIVDLVRGMPHVAQATGNLVHPISNLDSITGINLAEFNRMSGGFKFIEGGPFRAQNDMVVDRIFAQQKKLHAGDTFNYGHDWHITGVVEEGKLSRTFADMQALQEIFGENKKVSVIYVKVDDPKNTDSVIADIEHRLEGHKVYSMAEFVSLFTASGVPLVEGFTEVVIGVSAIVGFLGVFLAMYTAVLERTREIGILKAMGASPGYIMDILLRETLLLAFVGTVLGILATYGTRALLAQIAPNLPQMLVPDWYWKAALISIVGALIGAIYPGMKAARQDAIEALAYD